MHRILVEFKLLRVNYSGMRVRGVVQCNAFIRLLLDPVLQSIVFLNWRLPDSLKFLHHYVSIIGFRLIQQSRIFQSQTIELDLNKDTVEPSGHDDNTRSSILKKVPELDTAFKRDKWPSSKRALVQCRFWSSKFTSKSSYSKTPSVLMARNRDPACGLRLLRTP